MDQTEIHMRKNIEETRGAMGEKIDMIANRLHNTIIGPKVAADHLVDTLSAYTKAMQETTSATHNDGNAIHQAVAETIERVKATFNIIEQVKQDPWIMLAGAVLMGYVLSQLNGGHVFTLRQAHPQAQESRGLQSPTPAALP